MSERQETATDALIRVLAQLAECERREAELFAQMRRDLAEARAPIAAFLEGRQ